MVIELPGLALPWPLGGRGPGFTVRCNGRILVVGIPVLCTTFFFFSFSC